MVSTTRSRLCASYRFCVSRYKNQLKDIFKAQRGLVGFYTASFVSWYPLNQNHLISCLQILECWDHTPRTEGVICILNWSSVRINSDIENNGDLGVCQFGFKHDDLLNELFRFTLTWNTMRLGNVTMLWSSRCCQARMFFNVEYYNSSLPILFQFLLPRAKKALHL